VSGSCLLGSGQPKANHGHYDNCDSRNRPGLAAHIVVIQAFARRLARITAVSDSNSRAATASSWYQHHRARTDSDTAPASRGEDPPARHSLVRGRHALQAKRSVVCRLYQGKLSAVCRLSQRRLSMNRQLRKGTLVQEAWSKVPFFSATTAQSFPC
jgi:hypothetical protein